MGREESQKEKKNEVAGWTEKNVKAVFSFISFFFENWGVGKKRNQL